MSRELNELVSEVDELLEQAENWLWENNHIVDRYDPNYVEVLARATALKQVKALAERV